MSWGQYFEAVIGCAIAFVILMPVTWFLSRMNKDKWSFKKHYWFFIGAIIFTGLMERW